MNPSDSHNFRHHWLAGMRAENRTAEPGGRRRRPGGGPARLHGPHTGRIIPTPSATWHRFPHGNPCSRRRISSSGSSAGRPGGNGTRTLGGVPPAHELPQPGGHPHWWGRGPGGGRGACRLFGHGKTGGRLPSQPYRDPRGRGRNLPPAATSFGAALPNLLAGREHIQRSPLADARGFPPRNPGYPQCTHETYVGALVLFPGQEQSSIRLRFYAATQQRYIFEEEK